MDTFDLITESIGEELAAAGSHKVPAVTCTVEDELQPADIAEYLKAVGTLTTAQKSDEKDISTIRAKHHSVARLLATGIPEGIVAQMVGFTSAYISTLKNNPSMIELVNHYRAPGDNAAQVIAEKLRTVGDAALERIMTEIPNMDHQALLGAAKLGTDRSGNGPQSKVAHEHTHTLDLSKVAALAESARKRNAERIINVSQVRQQLPSAKPVDED